VLDPDQLNNLLPGNGLHAGFWFQSMHMTWDAAEIRACIDAPMQAVADPSMVGWVAASHDEVRPPTRFGGGDEGRERSLALSTILFGLPGLPLLYQGEELGLLEGVVPNHLRADPVGADVTASRDGCRTPMPWTGDGPSMGFSTSESTWLPMGGRTLEDTAEWQMSQPRSWFACYKELIMARRANPGLVTDPFVWLDLEPSMLGYQRGELVVVANVGELPTTLNLSGSIEYSTHGHVGQVANPVMDPGEAMFLKVEAQQ